MSNIFKIFVKKYPDIKVGDYVGEKGEIFFDYNLRKLKMSTGIHTGGGSITVDMSEEAKTLSIGSSTTTASQLRSDSIAYSIALGG
tara:strand:- start:1685 stop:1942 length:258 start_codon:yes stop_codon:yes gene_type:complete